MGTTTTCFPRSKTKMVSHFTGVAVDVRVTDVDHVVLPWAFVFSAELPRTDEAGVLQAGIKTVRASCVPSLCGLLTPSCENPDPRLPIPAFVVLRFPDTDQEVSIQVTENMVSSNPEDEIDVWNLGVVTIARQ